MRKILVIAVSLLTGAVPLSADQPANPQASAKLGALRQTPSNPYAKLFATRGAVAAAVEQQAAKPTAPKSRVVCGMTVIEVSPAIDPKMGVTPPTDKTRYTIRALEPPICK